MHFWILGVTKRGKRVFKKKIFKKRKRNFFKLLFKMKLLYKKILSLKTLKPETFSGVYSTISQSFRLWKWFSRVSGGSPRSADPRKLNG